MRMIIAPQKNKALSKINKGNTLKLKVCHQIHLVDHKKAFRALLIC